jgi:hypothetical protein
VLIKRQNGEAITGGYIAEFESGLNAVQSVFGDISVILPTEKTLVLSHSSTKHMYASKAIGVFMPSWMAIGVSAKYGNEQFQDTLAHEIAHLLDHQIGQRSGRRFETDDYASPAFMIANMFRGNMNQPSDSGYLNSTKECFARALQQYFAIQTRGTQASGIYDQPLPGEEAVPYIRSKAFISEEKFNELAPTIKAFLESYLPTKSVEKTSKFSPENEVNSGVESLNFDSQIDNDLESKENDLFNDFDSLPDTIKEILNQLDEDAEYSDVERIQKLLEANGYTFDFGLDGVPQNLRKLPQTSPDRKRKLKLAKAKLNLLAI